MLFDVIWLPASCQKSYANLCLQTVKLLGGRELIPEDVGFYSFRAEDIRPRNSFGPLACLILVPSVVITGSLCLLSFRSRANSKRNIAAGILLLLTIAGFVTYHVLLRWQTIGIGRLMLPCLVTGVPLAAFMMERTWARALGLPLFAGVLLAYSSFGFGVAMRRVTASEKSWLTAQVSKLQRSHNMTLEWEWKGEPMQSQEIKEGYTKREIVRQLLSRLPNPTSFGLIGTNNAEGYYLFGDDFLNKVVSMSDSRAELRFLSPPDDIEFIVAEDFEPQAIPPEALRGFELLARVSSHGKTVLAVFQRTRNL
jgi:hypothetical protein